MLAVIHNIPKTDMQYSVLMVDDHPMIVEGYQNTLLKLRMQGYDFDFESAYDCDSAVQKINQASHNGTPFDAMFVDIKLPPSTDGKYTSGEDLVILARERMPTTKVIVLTMFVEGARLYNILKTADPDGLVVKSDLTSNELVSAFKHVLDDPPYYSNTVEKYLRRTMRNDFVLDETNRKIIYYLSQGVQTQNLIKHIDLSLSAIEKRKRYIKEILGVEDGRDETLLSEARKRGLI